MLNLSKQPIDHLVPKDHLYSLRVLKTPRAGKTLAMWLMLIGTIMVVVLFLPWQQNIHGKGHVTALSPVNRPQTIQTTIAGRIQDWKVQEGEFVQKGDTITIISEIKEKYFDPQLLQRLGEVIASKEKSLQSKELKSGALRRQIEALETGMRTKVEQSKAKLAAEAVRFANTKNQYERNKKLFEAGNIPLTKFQEIEYKYQGSEADYVNAEIEIERVQAEFLDKINKAESELNNTLAEQFDTQAEISKLKNEFANMEIRAQQYFILAPQSGFVVKASQAGIGETIKEGDPVCTIMPHSSDVAVEMYVRAMDVPLLTRGRKVRIEFDGFPALQFTGWPSVSVGTFGGRVEVIDFVSSRAGEFRILVVPDPQDEKWPSQLRAGSGTMGWVMLDSVPIWYEVWRQLNGFPPSLYAEPEDEKKKLQEEKKKKSNVESGG